MNRVLVDPATGVTERIMLPEVVLMIGQTISHYRITENWYTEFRDREQD